MNRRRSGTASTGPYAFQYWCLVGCNIVALQFLWFKRVRSSPVLLFISAIVVLSGMWLERYMIIISCKSKFLLLNCPKYQ